MSNPFKEIQETKAPSEDLRRRVMDDIDKVKLTLDIAELFLLQSSEIITSLFKTDKK